jgi:hypothetical protein
MKAAVQAFRPCRCAAHSRADDNANQPKQASVQRLQLCDLLVSHLHLKLVLRQHTSHDLQGSRTVAAAAKAY